MKRVGVQSLQLPASHKVPSSDIQLCHKMGFLWWLPLANQASDASVRVTLHLIHPWLLALHLCVCVLVMRKTLSCLVIPYPVVKTLPSLTFTSSVWSINERPVCVWTYLSTLWIAVICLWIEPCLCAACSFFWRTLTCDMICESDLPDNVVINSFILWSILGTFPIKI